MFDEGFSVVGVDLVVAACRLSAERLAAVSGSPVAVQSVKAVGDTLHRCQEAVLSGDGSIPTPIATGDSPLATALLPLSSGGGSPPPGASVPPVSAASSPTSSEDLPGAIGATQDGATGDTPYGSSLQPDSELLSLPTGHSTFVTNAPRRTQLHSQAMALMAQGDLFSVSDWPGDFFDFVYDCQGLHAMPSEQRPAYVAVLQRVLRSGGLALLLVGRVEEDNPGGEPSGAWQAHVSETQPSTPSWAVTKTSTAAGPERTVISNAAMDCPLRPQNGSTDNGDGSISGKGTGEEANTDALWNVGRWGGGKGKGDAAIADPRGTCVGPSQMTLEELQLLFAATDWEWCWHERTCFDLTPTYARLARPPQAWCLLVRRH